MIYFEFLAAYGSTDTHFHRPDFQNLELCHFRWLFWGYHIQVMNQENDPKWPIFGQKLVKIGQKIAIFGPFLDQTRRFLRKFCDFFLQFGGMISKFSTPNFRVPKIDKTGQFWSKMTIFSQIWLNSVIMAIYWILSLTNEWFTEYYH